MSKKKLRKINFHKRILSKIDLQLIAEEIEKRGWLVILKSKRGNHNG